MANIKEHVEKEVSELMKDDFGELVNRHVHTAIEEMFKGKLPKFLDDADAQQTRQSLKQEIKQTLSRKDGPNKSTP